MQLIEVSMRKQCHKTNNIIDSNCHFLSCLEPLCGVTAMYKVAMHWRKMQSCVNHGSFIARSSEFLCFTSDESRNFYNDVQTASTSEEFSNLKSQSASVVFDYNRGKTEQTSAALSYKVQWIHWKLPKCTKTRHCSKGLYLQHKDWPKENNDGEKEQAQNNEIQKSFWKGEKESNWGRFTPRCQLHIRTCYIYIHVYVRGGEL